MSTPKSSGRTGTIIVLLIIALGITGAVISRNYWRGVMQRTYPTTQPTTPDSGAGAAPWNAVTARRELEDLRHRFDQSEGSGNNAALMEDTRRLVERYPRYAEARNLYAQVLLFSQQGAAAYDQVKTSLEIDRQQPEMHWTAGVLADQMQLLDEAQQHYERAVDLAPKEPRYRVSLANLYLKRGDLDRARGTLLEALALDSSQHDAYAVLSAVYAQENKLELALNQIQKAIENTPSTQRALQIQYILREAMLLRRKNEPEKALLVLDALSPREKTTPAVVQDTAVSWSMMGKFDHAAAVYEDAMSSDMTNWHFAAEAAKLRVKAGDMNGAKKDIEAIRKIDPRLEVIGELEKLVK